MYFTKLTLRSVTFVADSPRLSPKHLYKIPDTTPWIVTNSDVQPFYNFKADVLTPAPRDSGPNARSWLVFEGPIHAESTTSPITVHATASNYYHEIPLSYRLPEPQIYGQLLMHILIDSDTVSAKSNQVMGRTFVCHCSSIHIQRLFSNLLLDQYFWINGIITNTKESFIYVEIDALIV
ncbi:uncharacterized protein PGTG_11582 [Puccinia graminis f. sp. tritici CRL 75-36-700-3]|uniref:Uncharacterized protein n=1 Tax=Puccinia graminis f. sp. tritici (strain CRL 75-36-700-3 / race SCCL) TaxID=418459 RepID=E3KNF1_PUCGT|nr:uncharacterized protein PGTG_11582 [Puccinia graminis f. sp. tritici CRL 75-36-700-3]EFP85826.2 hypothetical protein PGTG_11582 [Puccinia graminis f. sp. tritici CRL 75-36-700-3]